MECLYKTEYHSIGIEPSNPIHGRRIGCPAVERTKRTVKLTSAGEFLKVKWTGVLEEFNLTRQYAKKIEKGESGCIRISQPDSISFSIMPELLQRMAVNYPELKVELLQLNDASKRPFCISSAQ